MSDFLPPVTGKKIDALFGNGSVALITDEVLVSMTPTKVNGIDGCISVSFHDSQGCCDVHPAMPERHKTALLKELAAEGSSFTYLTMPCCSRSRADAWNTAACLLEAMAAAARAQAKTATK
jgi:hypothetical protein